jgi:hypothetical protein
MPEKTREEMSILECQQSRSVFRQFWGSSGDLWADKKNLFFGFWSFLLFLRGVKRLLCGVRGAAADADVGVSDEGDALDDLLPRALDPRVFASHSESVLRV